MVSVTITIKIKSRNTELDSKPAFLSKQLGERMDNESMQIIMDECCDPPDEDGLIKYLRETCLKDKTSEVFVSTGLKPLA